MATSCEAAQDCSPGRTWGESEIEQAPKGREKVINRLPEGAVANGPALQRRVTGG